MMKHAEIERYLQNYHYNRICLEDEQAMGTLTFDSVVSVSGVDFPRLVDESGELRLDDVMDAEELLSSLARYALLDFEKLPQKILCTNLLAPLLLFLSPTGSKVWWYLSRVRSTTRLLSQSSS